MDAARYYSDLTLQYERYAAGTHGWHYGVWEPDVTSHPQALIRSNELLLRGLTLTEGSRILDVGFGSGGFSVWAARQTGAHVTGISLSADHVELATRRAAVEGVGERCRFLMMDMDVMQFDNDGFDLVVNQETFCHASDKVRFAASVFRVLRPGGWWRAVDFSVREGSLSPEEVESYRQVCEGFHVPSLASAQTTTAILERTGFEASDATDVTTLVRRTASHILRQSYLPLLAYRLGLDRMFRPTAPAVRRNRIGHVQAALHYSRGLKRGFFRHVYYSARKPLPPR